MKLLPAWIWSGSAALLIGCPLTAQEAGDAGGAPDPPALRKPAEAAIPAGSGEKGTWAGEEIFSVLRVARDPEGTVNVRGGPSTGSKVTGKVRDGAPVILEWAGKQEEGKGEGKEGAGTRNGWAAVQTGRDAGETGYIHASRLEDVRTWKLTGAAAVTAAERSEAPGRAESGGYRVEVRGVPFVPADHRITRDENGQELVDGDSPWGRDGGLPAESLTLRVRFQGKALTLPPEACRNLYEPEPSSLVLLSPSPADGRLLVLMSNSDGAGAYCVVWGFKNGAYLGREVFVPF